MNPHKSLLQSTRNLIKRTLSLTRSLPSPGETTKSHFFTGPNIVVIVSGGLCNQLMCYSAARRLANLKNCPIFAYSNRFDSKDHTRWMLDRYPLKIALATDSVTFFSQFTDFTTSLNYESLFEEDGKPISNEQYSQLETSILSQNTSLIDFNTALYYFRSDIDAYRPTSDLLKELTPNLNHLSGYAKHIERSLNESENSVAIHIRRGDFLNPENDLAIEPEYYHHAIRLINSKLSNCSFYVFSDDLDWCNTNFSSYPNLTLVRNPEGNSAVEDLYLASLCKHFILTNHSTFSHWMTELRTARENTLILTNSKEWLITSRNIKWYFTPKHCTVISRSSFHY
jgi:hypothetical protein